MDPFQDFILQMYLHQMYLHLYSSQHLEWRRNFAITIKWE